MITAQLSSASCPRCRLPIAKGQRIEPYTGRGDVRRKWAHVGCSDAHQAQSNGQNRNNSRDHDDDDIEPQDVPKLPARNDAQETIRQKTAAAMAEALQQDKAQSETEEAAARYDADEAAAKSSQANGERHDREQEIKDAFGSANAARQFGQNGTGRSAAETAKIRERLLGLIREEVGNAFSGQAAEQTARLNNAIQGINSAVASAFGSIEDMARKAAADAVKDLPLLKTIEIKSAGRDAVKITGELLHEAFESCLQLACAGKNILLVGPTGCGKSHLAEQVAKVIPNADGTSGRRFGAISCTAGLTEAKLLGRANMNLSNGEDSYQESDFVRCYEQGGVFLLDEMDGCDPNLLLVINSALANGFLPLADRRANPMARRHKDFVLIATANTYGKGADRRYCGRFPLDRATLDRFKIGTLDMDYSREVEKRLCPDDKLRVTLWLWRQKMSETRVEDNLSTRFIIDARDMLAAGWTMAKIERAFFAGWRRDEILKVLGRDVTAA